MITNDSYLRDNSQIDVGIPTDETASLYNQTQYVPDMRSDFQVDAGISDDITASSEAKSFEEYKKRLKYDFDNFRQSIIKNVQTDYSQSNIPVKPIVLEYDFDERWALDHLLVPYDLNSKTVETITAYLEKINNNKEMCDQLINSIFEELNSIREKLYNELNSEKLTVMEQKKLLTFLTIFSIINEKQLNFGLENFKNVKISGEYGSTFMAPIDIGIKTIADTIDEKGMVGSKENIINPINIITNTYGKEEINYKELTNLIIKALNTKHKLSDDALNFPVVKSLENGSMDQSDNMKREQLKEELFEKKQKLEELAMNPNIGGRSL